MSICLQIGKVTHAHVKVTSDHCFVFATNICYKSVVVNVSQITLKYACLHYLYMYQPMNSEIVTPQV